MPTPRICVFILKDLKKRLKNYNQDLCQHKKLFREMYIFVGSSSAKSFQIGQRITDQILCILLKIQEPNMYARDAKEAGFEGDLVEDNR